MGFFIASLNKYRKSNLENNMALMTLTVDVMQMVGMQSERTSLVCP